MLKRSLLTVAAALSVTASALHAQSIVSAVSGTINSGGPGFGSLADTYNQNGLGANYVSGVTNFDSFLSGGGPAHTSAFPGFEWFSNAGSSSASVTYDLGSVLGINKIALWNEEVSGIGLLDLFGSTDGLSFFSLASGLTPTDNSGSNYRADVFEFAATNLRYVRMDMSRCPQPTSSFGTFESCAIGEVAFRTASVPEPGTLALLSFGLSGIAVLARRRRSV